MHDKDEKMIKMIDIGELKPGDITMIDILQFYFNVIRIWNFNNSIYFNIQNMFTK